MKRQRLGPTLFWIGFLIATAFTSIGTWSLMHNLRTLSAEQLNSTIWALDGPLFIFWAFSVALGSVVASIGAFMFVKTKPAFTWLGGFGVLAAVILMVMVWSRVYISMLFGIGGIVIIASFFAIVWIWMKRYAELGIQEKIAGSYKLVGYLFWVNASWFLCGETAKMHLKAFEGSPAPSPIEIMVFLVLGWIFVLVGEFRSKSVSVINRAQSGSEARDLKTSNAT